MSSRTKGVAIALVVAMTSLSCRGRSSHDDADGRAPAASASVAAIEVEAAAPPAPPPVARPPLPRGDTGPASDAPIAIAATLDEIEKLIPTSPESDRYRLIGDIERHLPCDRGFLLSKRLLADKSPRIREQAGVQLMHWGEPPPKEHRVDLVLLSSAPKVPAKGGGGGYTLDFSMMEKPAGLPRVLAASRAAVKKASSDPDVSTHVANLGLAGNAGDIVHLGALADRNANVYLACVIADALLMLGAQAKAKDTLSRVAACSREPYYSRRARYRLALLDSTQTERRTELAWEASERDPPPPCTRPYPGFGNEPHAHGR